MLLDWSMVLIRYEPALRTMEKNLFKVVSYSLGDFCRFGPGCEDEGNLNLLNTSYTPPVFLSFYNWNGSGSG